MIFLKKKNELFRGSVSPFKPQDKHKQKTGLIFFYILQHIQSSLKSVRIGSLVNSMKEIREWLVEWLVEWLKLFKMNFMKKIVC